MTPLKISIAATAVSVLLLLVVFELIRSRRLRERYALLWLATGVVLVVLSAWRGGLNTIAGWFGVRGDAVHSARQRAASASTLRAASAIASGDPSDCPAA